MEEGAGKRCSESGDGRGRVGGVGRGPEGGGGGGGGPEACPQVTEACSARLALKVTSARWDEDMHRAWSGLFEVWLRSQQA